MIYLKSFKTYESINEYPEIGYLSDDFAIDIEKYEEFKERTNFKPEPFNKREIEQIKKWLISGEFYLCDYGTFQSAYLNKATELKLRDERITLTFTKIEDGWYLVRVQPDYEGEYLYLYPTYEDFLIFFGEHIDLYLSLR